MHALGLWLLIWATTDLKTFTRFFKWVYPGLFLFVFIVSIPNQKGKWPSLASFYLFSSSLCRYLTKCKYVISSLFYFMSTGKTTKNYFNYLNLYYLSQARDDQNFILLVLVILVLSNGFVKGWKNLSMHACMHACTYLPT